MALMNNGVQNEGTASLCRVGVATHLVGVVSIVRVVHHPTAAPGARQPDLAFLVHTSGRRVEFLEERTSVVFPADWHEDAVDLGCHSPSGARKADCR